MCCVFGAVFRGGGSSSIHKRDRAQRSVYLTGGSTGVAQRREYTLNIDKVDNRRCKALLSIPIDLSLFSLSHVKTMCAIHVDVVLHALHVGLFLCTQTHTHISVYFFIYSHAFQ